MKIRLILTSIALTISAIAFSQDYTVRAFAHRGGRMENDENTMAAFQKSYSIGYTGYETDVRMTKDGVLIICHDHTLDRTTNGHGIIEEMNWEDIKKFRTKGGNKILTVQELVDFFKDKPGLYIEWEMKTSPAELYPQERLEEYCDKLYKIVSKNKPKDADYLFTSFDTRALRYMKAKYPDADYLYISGGGVTDESINIAMALGIDRIGCVMGKTTSEMVKKAKSKGLRVSLWPSHTVEDFLLGVALGSEFLCTDIPEQTMKVMKEKYPDIKVRY